MWLSKNFSLSEFICTSHNVELKPTSEQIKNMQILCQTLLQPVRDVFGVPMAITSGFRSNELNDLVGGSKTSQHLNGEAADFEFTKIAERDGSLALWDAFCWIYWNRIFGQVIIYVDAEDKGALYKFIHVSTGVKKEPLVNFDGKFYNIEKLLIY